MAVANADGEGVQLTTVIGSAEIRLSRELKPDDAWVNVVAAW